MANETTLARDGQQISGDSHSTDVSFLDLAIMLAKRQKFIFRFTIGATVLSAAIVLLLPNRYTAETTIIPPQQSQSSAAMMTMASLGPLAGLAGGALQLRNQSDLYAAIMQSESVENSVIGDYDLQSVYRDKTMADTRETLESRTTVKVLPKEGMIRISVRDRDAKRAAAIANAYVSELLKLNARLAISEASQRRVFYEKELQQAKENLTAAEIALKQTQQKTGMLQVDSQARAIIQAFAQMKAQIAAKEVEIQAMQSFATSSNPKLQLAEQELNALKLQLAKLQNSTGDTAGDLQIPTTKIPEAGLEYIRAFREVKYNEAIFEILAKQYEAARLDEARNSAVIQVVDPASIPEKKSWPPRALLLMAGITGGFLLSLGLVAISESYRRFRLDPTNESRIELLRTYFSG